MKIDSQIHPKATCSDVTLNTDRVSFVGSFTFEVEGWKSHILDAPKEQKIVSVKAAGEDERI